MKIRILVLLPIRKGTISHFCKWYPGGLVRGLKATIAKMETFGAETPEVHVDVVDITTRAKKLDNPNAPLIAAAKLACDRKEIHSYDVLISGTSPISREVIAHVKNSGFSGAHFLVAFDKDIVRDNVENCLRLLPHYDLELSLYVQIVNRLRPSRCVFLHLEDTTSTNLATDVATVLQCHGFNIRSHKVQWDTERWPETDIKRALEGSDLLIANIYSDQIKKLAQICNKMCDTLRPKNVLVNLDGVDRHGEDIDDWKGLWAIPNSSLSTNNDRLGNNWMLAPSCEFSDLVIPNVADTGKVIVAEYDSNLLPTSSGQLVKFRSRSKKRGNYVAGYGFDTGTAIILAALAPHRCSINGMLSKEDVLKVLPFQGITGAIRVNSDGDLQIPLSVADVSCSKSEGKLSLQPLDSLISTPTVRLHSQNDEHAAQKESSFSKRIKDFIGSSIKSTKHLCFLEISHQDSQSSDLDLHWCIAAPSYETLKTYVGIVKTFGDRQDGYRIGNHPVVRSLLPILTTKKAVNAQDIMILGGAPPFRHPDNENELRKLFEFVSSHGHETNWEIELAEYLASSWQSSPPSGKKKHKATLPSLVFKTEATSYSAVTNEDALPHVVPSLSELWDVWVTACKMQSQSSSSLMTNGGHALQKVYMAPVFIRPDNTNRFSGFATSLSEINNYSIAQIYMGIGWDTGEKEEAEKEAAYTLESLRAWLLEQSSRERLRNRDKNEGVAEALDVFAHQVRTLASQSTAGWMVSPSRWDELKAAIEKKLTGQCHKEHQVSRIKGHLASAKIMPLPDIYSSLSTTLFLWSLSIEPAHMFPASVARRFRMPSFPGDLSELAKFAMSHAQLSLLAKRCERSAFAREMDLLEAWKMVDDMNVDLLDTRNLYDLKIHRRFFMGDDGQPFLTNGGNRRHFACLSGLLRLLTIYCEDFLQKTANAKLIIEFDPQLADATYALLFTSPFSRENHIEKGEHVGADGKSVRDFVIARFFEKSHSVRFGKDEVLTVQGSSQLTSSLFFQNIAWLGNR